MKKKNGAISSIIENRKARHDYFVNGTLECGIVLRGNEVKSLKAGSADLKQAWCSVKNKQLILHGLHITAYGAANKFDVDERRDRVLLAHKSEIRKLSVFSENPGNSLIPLKIYFTEGKAKVLIGSCTGKHNYDKRNSLKERDIKREIDKSMKERY